MFALLRLALFALIVHPFASQPAAGRPASTQTLRGSFADGATYLIQVPTPWNGTLLVFSHGYVGPGQPNPALDVGDPTTGAYLLAHGYALAGSSYAQTGWAVAQALPDQLEVVSTFDRLVGTPTRTIAWGTSMGGLVTAALVQQAPGTFSAALPMCGVVGGAVGTWNYALDAAYAFNTLVAGGQLQVVDISNPTANYQAAVTILNSAQQNAPGQARIALAAALADIPGWFGEGSPQPGPTDYPAQENGQYQWFAQNDFLFDFSLRAELEARAGGNPSWNAGIDYRRQLAASADRAEVQALYAAAGLDLSADLATLNRGATIAALPAALTYLADNIILDGRLGIPVLTIHTVGDGLIVNESESAYAAAVRGSGQSALLRQAFVARAGHCAFTPGETLAAFEVLIRRLDSGQWSGLTPAALNGVAQRLGAAYNPFAPAYVTYAPGPFLRTYNGMPPTPARGLRHYPFEGRRIRSQ